MPARMNRRKFNERNTFGLLASAVFASRAIVPHRPANDHMANAGPDCGPPRGLASSRSRPVSSRALYREPEHGSIYEWSLSEPRTHATDLPFRGRCLGADPRVLGQRTAADDDRRLVR